MQIPFSFLLSINSFNSAHELLYVHKPIIPPLPRPVPVSQGKLTRKKNANIVAFEFVSFLLPWPRINYDANRNRGQPGATCLPAVHSQLELNPLSSHTHSLLTRQSLYIQRIPSSSHNDQLLSHAMSTRQQ